MANTVRRYIGIHNIHNIKTYAYKQHHSSSGWIISVLPLQILYKAKIASMPYRASDAIPLSNYLLKRAAVCYRSPKFSIFNLPTACRYISPTIYI